MNERPMDEDGMFSVCAECHENHGEDGNHSAKNFTTCLFCNLKKSTDLVSLEKMRAMQKRRTKNA